MKLQKEADVYRYPFFKLSAR